MVNLTIAESLYKAEQAYLKLGDKSNIEKLVQIAQSGQKEVFRDYKFVVDEMTLLGNNAVQVSNSCGEAKKRAEDENVSLRAAYERLNEEMKTKKREMSDTEVEIIGLRTEVNGLQSQIVSRQEEINSLNREIDDINASVRRKRDDVEKYCWIPFYSCYLLGDFINASNERKGRINSRLESIRDIVTDLNNKMAELKKKMSDLSAKDFKSSDLAKEISLIQQKLSENIRKIIDMNADICTWGTLEVLFNEAADSLKSAISAARIINAFMLIIEVSTEYKKAVEAAKAITGLTDGLQYRGNVLYPGQHLNKGEYLASLNKHFVAVLKNDGTFVVSDGKNVLWKAPGAGDELKFENGVVSLNGWRTKRDGASVLIMQDNGNLVTYNDGFEPLWATDTWAFGAVDNGVYNIPLKTYWGKYKIVSQNNLCLDVTDGSVDNNTELRIRNDSGVDSQKFIIEPLPSGYHRITAVHSGKSLGIRGGSLDNTANLVQLDYCCGSNQHFWILPCAKQDCVKIVAVHSGMPIDVAGADFSNNTRLQQYFENGTPAQIFKLVECI
jgi:predicted  nucleic acid-binding Zn-ribbon protein